MGRLPIENQAKFSHPKYRRDIDGLRAIAVLSVVGFHLVPTWIRGGFIGVDIFFVISGYLISSIIFGNLDSRTFSFREFYIRRIKRIFPALILVMGCCYLVGWFTLFQLEFGNLGRDIAGGAGFVSNLIFWKNTNYWVATVETSPLLHLWSLGVEEQFYILWPLTAVLLWKRDWNITVCLIAIAAASFALNVNFVNSSPAATFYLPITRLWELLVGAALSWSNTRSSVLSGNAGEIRAVRSPFLRFDNGRSVAGIALIGLALLVLDKEDAFPGWWCLLPTIGSCLIISAGPRAWINRTLLSHRILVWFGLISYPLYLWHWAILSFQFQVLDPRTQPYERAAIVMLASIALSALTFRFVEKPVRLVTNGTRTAIALTIAMTMSGIVGITTLYFDGFPSRDVNLSEGAKLVSYHQNLQLGKEYRAALREECNFKSSDNPDMGRAVPRECRGAGIAGTWFLWGDSHAQALSSGLRKILPQGFELAQVATSGCGPESSNRGCDIANKYAMSVISDLKPEIVWMAQQGNHEQVDWQSLAMELKQAGVRKVFLVGPAPQWKPSLPVVLAYYYPRQRSDFVSIGIDAEIIRTDLRLRSKYESSAHQPGLGYISLVEKLCTQDGCLATVPESLHLMTHDYGHLSTEGSQFVGTNILQKYVTSSSF